MYVLCIIFLIFDCLDFFVILFKTLDAILSFNFDFSYNFSYYLSLISFLLLTGLTTLFYVGHLIQKNGKAIEKNTRKKKKTKHLIVVRCDDNELRDAIYNIINTKGSIPLTCADAITDEEEDKLWYLTARVQTGSFIVISISITDCDEKELSNLTRSSHEKSNAISLLSYDLEKMLWEENETQSK